uniref:Uncharacterized protein n=1 Tax=Rhizophora mucronata TaxID=61149 RepID=A0A2P2NFC8_RHIMU
MTSHVELFTEQRLVIDVVKVDNKGRVLVKGRGIVTI